MATDEEAREANDALGKAVRQYHKVISPDAYVDDWVVVVHKESVALAAEDSSVVSTAPQYEQPFHRTAGLLAISYSEVKRSFDVGD